MMNPLFFAAILLLTACSSVQPSAQDLPAPATKLISFTVKNNTVLPHKYTFIGYNPGETGNWTNSFVLLPGAARTYKCAVGTKIYLADNKQVSVVMGGGSIREDEPFITVKVEDDGKVFGLKQ
jgi:ABC-type Fe3+-hydroxamate transport system substrate-binding protein